MKSIKKYEGRNNNYINQINKKIQPIHDKISKAIYHAQLTGQPVSIEINNIPLETELVAERLKQADIKINYILDEKKNTRKYNIIAHWTEPTDEELFRD